MSDQPTTIFMSLPAEERAKINRERLKLFFTISLCEGMIHTIAETVQEITSCNQATRTTESIPPMVIMSSDNPLRGMTTDQKCAYYESILADFRKKLATAKSVYKTGQIRKQTTTGKYKMSTLSAEDFAAYTSELDKFTRLQIHQFLVILGKNICGEPTRGSSCNLY